MRRQRARKDYTVESLHEEREYGLYWYSWLWHLLRPWLIGLCSILLVMGIVSYGWNKLSAAYIDPIDSKDDSQVLFVVKAGDSLSRVATNLQANKLIRNRSVFKYYADFMGFGQKIQSGEYSLKRSMSIADIAETLTQGDGKPIVRNITIIPGWTVEDIAAYLVKEGVIADGTNFLNKCRSGSEYNAYYYVSDVLTGGTAAKRKYVLEGYLAANTYEIYLNATEDDIIRRLLSQTEALYKEAFHQRAQELGLTMDQSLALASLIEKEAKTDDFRRVSAVFHNRLKKNMPLGSDVTIKYALGIKRMVLTKQDLDLDSPFNSYRNKGLPPGPICAPSPKALEAALYPDEDFVKEQYLYFCSKDPDTGELHFSKTLAEHEQAVKIYAPLWEAYDQRSGAQ